MYGQAINSQLAPQAQVSLEWDRRGLRIKTPLQQTQPTSHHLHPARIHGRQYSWACLGLRRAMLPQAKQMLNADNISIGENKNNQSRFPLYFPLT